MHSGSSTAAPGAPTWTSWWCRPAARRSSTIFTRYCRRTCRSMCRAEPSSTAPRAGTVKRWRSSCRKRMSTADYFHAGLPAGDQEKRSAEFHPRRPTGHRRHQRLRHGHRQTGRAPRDPRRHSRIPGELPAGGGKGGPGPAGGPLCAALRPGRRGAPVWYVGPFQTDAAGNPRECCGRCAIWTAGSA